VASTSDPEGWRINVSEQPYEPGDLDDVDDDALPWDDDEYEWRR
jgi:hypothetical protein